MTTTIETYRAALEHIRDGSDALCTDCGWIGLSLELDDKKVWKEQEGAKKAAEEWVRKTLKEQEG